METLRPSQPIIPRVANPEDDLRFGLSVGSTLQQQALAQQNLALQQAKVDLLPQDRKYSTALQTAQITRLQAQADADRANAELRRHRATPTPYTASSWDDSPVGAATPAATATSTDDLPVADDGAATSSGLFQSAPALPSLLDTAAPTDDDQTGDALSLDSAPSVPSLSSASATPASGLRTVTVFGTNMDGSPDKQDNGVTAFGRNSRDPNARIASVPFAEARQRDLEAGGPGTLEHFKTLPPNLRMMAIANPATGQSTTAEAAELGPSEDAQSGATGDVTPAIMKDVGGTGKDKLAMSFLPISGAPKVPPLSGADAVDQIANSPLVEVSGAENPATAKVVNPSVIRVPTTQQEVDELQAKLNRNEARAKSTPGYGTDRNVTAAANRQVNDWRNEATLAIRTFQNRQAAAAHPARPTAAGRASAANQLADPTEAINNLTSQGFTPKSAEVKVGGVTQRFEQGNAPSAFLDDVEAFTGTRNLGQLKAGDVGNPIDPTTGKPDLTKRVFETPSRDGLSSTKVVVPTWWYDQHYIAGINKNFGGPTETSAPGLSPVSVPSFAPTAPQGLRPVRLALGRSAVVPDLTAPVIPSVAATPTPITSAATPSPAATDPTLRLAALRQEQTGETDDPRQKEIDEEDKATKRAIGEDRKYSAGEQAKVIAEKFDFNAFPLPVDQTDPTGGVRVDSPFDPLGPTGSRDPATQERLYTKIAQAAKGAGIDSYDLNAVIKELRQRRAQRALDELSPTSESEAIASRMQANRDSLLSGFVSSVGAKDRVIPDRR